MSFEGNTVSKAGLEYLNGHGKRGQQAQAVLTKECHAELREMSKSTYRLTEVTLSRGYHRCLGEVRSCQLFSTSGAGSGEDPRPKLRDTPVVVAVDRADKPSSGRS